MSLLVELLFSMSVYKCNKWKELNLGGHFLAQESERGESVDIAFCTFANFSLSLSQESGCCNFATLLA